MDLTDFQMTPQTWDLIVANTVLDHLPSARGDALARALEDGLVPGGYLFVSVFTTDEPGYQRLASQSETAFAMIDRAAFST